MPGAEAELGVNFAPRLANARGTVSGIDASNDLAGRRPVTISTVMRFDHATEVTTSELRVELMFSADDVSEAALRQLVGGTPRA